MAALGVPRLSGRREAGGRRRQQRRARGPPRRARGPPRAERQRACDRGLRNELASVLGTGETAADELRAFSNAEVQGLSQPSDKTPRRGDDTPRAGAAATTCGASSRGSQSVPGCSGGRRRRRVGTSGAWRSPDVEKASSSPPASGTGSSPRRAPRSPPGDRTAQRGRCGPGRPRCRARTAAAGAPSPG
jgi:hypothetical protein